MMAHSVSVTFLHAPLQMLSHGTFPVNTNSSLYQQELRLNDFSKRDGSQFASDVWYSGANITQSHNADINKEQYANNVSNISLAKSNYTGVTDVVTYLTNAAIANNNKYHNSEAQSLQQSAVPKKVNAVNKTIISPLYSVFNAFAGGNATTTTPVDSYSFDFDPTGFNQYFSTHNTSQILSDNVSFPLLSSTSEITASEEQVSANFWQVFLLIAFKLIIMGGIIVVAIMGNILVIVSISLNRKLRSLANHFLISLATADIMVAMCAMSFNLSVQLSGRWMFGAIICDLWNSFDVYFSTVSILHLCCISMDRYYAILKPLEYPIYMTRRVVFFMIIFSWLLPTLISFVPIFLGWYATSDHLENRALQPDACPFEVNTAFALISSGLSFWFPCTLMLIMYFRIFQEARKQENAIMSRTNSNSNMNSTKIKFSNILNLERFLNCFRRRRRKRSKKASDSEEQAPNLHLHHLPAIAEATRKTKSNKLMETPAPGRLSVTESVISAARCSTGSSPCLCSLSDKEVYLEKSNTLPSDKSRRVSLPIHDHSDNFSPSSEHAHNTEDHFNQRISISEIGVEHQISVNAEQSQMLVQDTTASGTASNGGNKYVSSPTTKGPRRQRSSSSTISVQDGCQLSRPIGHAPLMKREHKAARTLGIIMGAFILCWLPFFTWYVASNICGESCPTPEPVVTLLFWIGYFNSTLNPFIYAYFRKDFREAFRKTLRQLRCPCIKAPSYSSY